MILSCPRCGKDDVIIKIDVYYCPSCMAWSCDDCLTETRGKCPDCGTAITMEHMVRTYYEEHGGLPSASASEPTEASPDLCQDVREKALACYEKFHQAMKSNHQSEAKVAALEGYEAVKQLLEYGRVAVGDIAKWLDFAYFYAFLQGSGSGVEQVLFNLDSYEPLMGDPDVREGFNVIDDVCQTLLNNTDIEAVKAALSGSCLGRCFQLYGIYCCAMGKLGQGIDILEKSVDYLGEDEDNYLPITYDCLGMAQFHDGRIEDALHSIEKAATMEDDEFRTKSRQQRADSFRRMLQEQASDQQPDRGQGGGKWRFGGKG